MTRHRRRRLDPGDGGDGGFSFVEVLVSVVVLGLAGTAVLGAAAAAARGSSTHRKVADVQVVAAAAADAVMGVRPVPCDDIARQSYRDAISARLAGLDLGPGGTPTVAITDVREWNGTLGRFQACTTSNPDLLTPQLLTLAVTGADGMSRTVQAMTGALPPTVNIGNPLAYANSPFAVISAGDTAMNGNFHVWGGAAIGGNLTFNGGAEVGHQDGGTFIVPGEAHVTSLLVNGAIDFQHSAGQLTVLSGWLHVGSLPPSSVSGANVVKVQPPGAPSSATINGNGGTSQAGATAGIVRPNVFDFAGAFDAFRKASTALGYLPGQCVNAVAARLVDAHGNPTTDQNPKWSLTAGKVNVLTTTAAQLDALQNVNKDNGPAPNATTPLIVNVTDVHPVLRKGSATQGGWESYVIWNFPNATTLRVEGLVAGSLYAPFADVTLDQGEIRGAVVAKSLTGGNEVKWNNFPPAAFAIDCEREP